jgi:hypothetical protein
MKQKLKEIIDGTDTCAGIAFDIALIVLILYSVATLTIETIPEFADNWSPFFAFLNIL